MKKLKHEQELLKEAIRVGGLYLKKRGAGEFEPTDGSDTKITAIYRLLVHDGLVQPLAKDQEDLPHIRHKLALWMARNLPADHPLQQ
ncbi:DUF5062 family protein [Motiliproteus sp. SC1-56]|uniref:DUF5062 family protein n=1 Tax=Motiliproteus sp. SC1-56 TaxID=2799565 RepID=UPI001A8D1EE4|nr:DUF5062 family protein [Motiliproteus sp. SC1-56]